MKNHEFGVALVLLFPVLAWAQQIDPAQITVDNQTTDSIFISRLGAPDQSVLFPKRIVRGVEVPLVAGGAESLQMLQVTFPNSIIVPETSFAGFNGRFAQSANLTVSPPRNVKIQYNRQAASDSATSAPIPSDGSGLISSGGSAGIGNSGRRQEPNGSGNYQTAKPSQTNTASRRTQSPDALSTTNRNGEKRKITLPATGLRVKVTSPGPETLITPPEPPAPIQTSKPVVAVKQSTSTDTAPARKSSLRSIIIWSSIATGLVGFVIWKRGRSK